MSDPTRTPQEEILRRRFASGEIGAGEYQRLLGILKGEGNAFGRGKKSKLVAAGIATRLCSRWGPEQSMLRARGVPSWAQTTRNPGQTAVAWAA